MIFVYVFTILIGIMLFAQGIRAEGNLGAFSTIAGAALIICGALWVWEELHARRRS